MSAAPVSWYFEDFFPGQIIDLGEQQVTEEEIVAFAAKFDPQPFHVDPAAAANSIYGGVIASGWHTCAMMMRLVVEGLMAASSSMGSPGLDSVRWLAPVRGGDVLKVRYETVKTKPSESKADRGVVWSRWVARNQDGADVCTIEGMGMFRRRPQGGIDA